MSLAEIEKAVDELPPRELTKLAAYIARRDKLAWDRELEEDFSPGAKHENTLEKIAAEIESGNFTPLPCLRTRCRHSGTATTSRLRRACATADRLSTTNHQPTGTTRS